MGEPLRAAALKLSPRPAGAGTGIPDVVSAAGLWQPGLTAAWAPPQPCSPAPIFTPCLIQSPADCEVPAYLPDREFLASSSTRLLPSPAQPATLLAIPVSHSEAQPPTPTSPSGSTELILFAWPVNLNSFKYASAGLGGRTLMLQNRGLASKEAGVTGAGLQECHLKANCCWGGGVEGATQTDRADVKLTQPCPAK